MTNPITDQLQKMAAGERARASIERSEKSRVAREAGIGTGVDPSYVQSMEAFEGFAHEDLFARAQEMSPGAIGQAATGWAGIGTAVLFGLSTFENAINREMASGWEGHAADAASAGVARFAESGRGLNEVLIAVANRLTEVNQSAQIVKYSVPRPELTSLLTVLPGLADPAAAHAAAQQREDARREAIRVMNTSYAPTYQPVGDNVPRLNPPIDPIGGGVGSSGAVGASVGDGRSGRVDDHGDPRGQATQSANADTGAAAGQPGTGSGGAPGASTASSGAGSQTSTPPANTSGSAVGSGTSTDTYGRGGGVSGNSGGGAGSVGGTRRRDDRQRDAMSGTLNGLGMGALGGGMAGAMPGGSEALRPGASVAAGAAATRGITPAGMFPPAQKGNGEDDHEHKTPTYLINVDNGNELIGQMSPAAPPVLGVWNDDK